MKMKYALLLLAALLLTSCVSTKKYKASEAQVASGKLLAQIRAENIAQLESEVASLKSTVGNLQADTSRLGGQLRQVKQEKAALAQTSSSALQQLSTELQQKKTEMEAAQALLDLKEKELGDKQQLLSAQTQKINDLNAQIDKQREAVNNLRASIEEALVGFNAEELTIENRNGKIYVSMAEKLLFKSGSAAVDPKGISALEKLADVLIKRPDISISVEGHTDNIPIKTARFDDNWDLSVIRATAVSRILLKKGVPAERITAAGRGEYFPIAPNDTPEGRSKNRRTEIVLSPKLDLLYELLRQ